MLPLGQIRQWLVGSHSTRSIRRSPFVAHSHTKDERPSILPPPSLIPAVRSLLVALRATNSERRGGSAWAIYSRLIITCFISV